MEEGIKELQKWAATELPNYAEDKALFTRFLLGCKLRQDKTKTKLKNFSKLRKTTPEWFEDRDPTIPELSYFLDCGVFTFQEQKLDEGNSIIIIRAAKYDPDIAHLRNLFKVSMMVLDVALDEEPQICEHGVVVIVDLEGIRWGHAMQLTPYYMKKAIHAMQDCYPIRIKSFHFINCPSYISIILGLIKRFLSEKLQKRIYTHKSDYEELLEVVPTRCLPKELKGTNGPIQDIINTWKKKITNRKDWLLQQNM